MPTIEETETLPSLMLSAAMCEWQSIVPGIRNLPVASMTVAPAGAVIFGPTSAILPSRMRTEPWNVPFVTVRTVAFWIRIGAAANAAALANAQSNKYRFIECLRDRFRRWVERPGGRVQPVPPAKAQTSCEPQTHI